MLNRIQGSPELRRTFIRDGPDGSIVLCPKAIEIYEAHVQDFLSAMVLPCQVAAGPPVRAPELLSLTIRNTARARHISIWEKLVMLYIQYHKGQEQSGIYRSTRVPILGRAGYTPQKRAYVAALKAVHSQSADASVKAISKLDINPEAGYSPLPHPRPREKCSC